MAPQDPVHAARLPAAGTWVIDLDGVVWLTGQPLPGAADGVRRLRDHGVRVLFVTNNAEPTVTQLLERLARCGIEADASELVTSAHAAASLVPCGGSALAVGGPGVDEALGARSVTVVPAGGDGRDGPVDAVVVGLTRSFDYQRLAEATMAVRQGARLIGTNEDPTHPTPDGLLPGSGALVAAVATASEVEPTFAGKPHPPMVALIRARADDVTAVVGDRPATDGRLAAALGVPFGLVRSAVLDAASVVESAAVVADGLGAVVAETVGGGLKGR